MTMYAAVENEELVWGLGFTPADAKRDAEQWIVGCDTGTRLDDLETFEITDEQAARIENGDVDWDSVRR